jgi:hypothetical protein
MLAQVDFWLDRADFYDQEWMPAVTTFDSVEDLALKLGSALKRCLGCIELLISWL